MQSIRTITDIIKKNGMDSKNYSQMDINSINVSLLLTKVIYRIINAREEDNKLKYKIANVMHSERSVEKVIDIDRL